MADVGTSHITSQDALCHNTLGRITSRSVKRDCMRYQVTLTVSGNYNATVCLVVAVLLHTTPMKENDTHKSYHYWSMDAYFTGLFKTTYLFRS